MTKTETANLAATMEQIHKVAEAGADIVRVAVPRDKDIEALKTIVVESPIPVIADIHFNHTLALKAIEAGAHCIRLNPGNIGGREKVAEVADLANRRGVPMRIGVNSGSLPKHLHELERENSVEALVTAAAEFVEMMESLDFTNFKVSIKSTNVPNTIATPRPYEGRGTPGLGMPTVTAEARIPPVNMTPISGRSDAPGRGVTVHEATLSNTINDATSAARSRRSRSMRPDETRKRVLTAYECYREPSPTTGPTNMGP